MSDPNTPEQVIELDHVTELMVQQWREHRKARPDVPPDYAANVDHLRRQVDAWQALDDGYRAVVGARLSTLALEIPEERAQ